MSDNDTPKKPSHLAYQVSEGQEGKSFFNKVGAAFEHKDKAGYNLQLDSIPVDGRVTLRTLKERVQETRDGTNGQSQTKDRESER